MRKRFAGMMVIGLMWLAVLGVPGVAAAQKESANSIVITFKDGHQQSFPVADVARIEFKPGPGVAKSAESGSETRGRQKFVGRWTVGDGNGGTYYFTFGEDGKATNTVEGGGRGSWTFVDGEAHVSWENGWHDAIRKVGTKYKKSAYAPGASFTAKPFHVTDAQKSDPI